jgi:hypothetical protein
MENFDFKISIKDSIHLMVLPKSNKDRDLSKVSYKFIICEDWRNVQIDKKEIIRFFHDRGVDIIKFDDDWTEDCDTSSGFFNVSSDIYAEEFVNIFNVEAELKYEKEIITHDISASRSSGWISINPTEDKTYIEFV